ncbi:MAG: antibiotic biosynthesis monooxygenase [Granulosicoccus sp.]|nr:antibiotic biosynthesis monooxygenase [Granulosicoccus sp.]
MIAVIFEVTPAPERKEEYLSIAASMRPMVEEVGGFISVERFQSLTNPDKLLSVSFFENEDAVKRWRTLAAHRSAQKNGRNGIFTDYRIRVAEVKRDYGLHERKQVPTDSAEVHER